MRFAKGLLAGLVATGLVGCGGSASRPSASGPSAFGAPVPGPSASPSARAQAKSSSSATAHARIKGAARTARAEPETRGGARAAAAQFYGLYSASQFAASWDLLVPAAKHLVSRSVWVGVHDGCRSVGAGRPRIIKAVTVFGNAAIVTEKIAGALSRLGTTQDVFNYAHHHWGYSPGALGIYDHGSVAADIAAAKAADFCASKKVGLL